MGLRKCISSFKHGVILVVSCHMLNFTAVERPFCSFRSTPQEASKLIYWLEDIRPNRTHRRVWLIRVGYLCHSGLCASWLGIFFRCQNDWMLRSRNHAFVEQMPFKFQGNWYWRYISHFFRLPWLWEEECWISMAMFVIFLDRFWRISGPPKPLSGWEKERPTDHAPWNPC